MGPYRQRSHLADHTNPATPLRTRTQRRFDALVEMAVRATTNGDGGGRPRPLVTVVVGDHSFRRLCELSEGTVLGPGELVPYVGDLDINAILFDGPFTPSAEPPPAPSAACSAGPSKSVTGSVNAPRLDGDPVNRCDVDHIVPVVDGGIPANATAGSSKPAATATPRRDLTAADITVWDGYPLVIAARHRLQTLITNTPDHPTSALLTIASTLDRRIGGTRHPSRRRLLESIGDHHFG